MCFWTVGKISAAYFPTMIHAQPQTMTRTLVHSVGAERTRQSVVGWFQLGTGTLCNLDTLPPCACPWVPVKEHWELTLSSLRIFSNLAN